MGYDDKGDWAGLGKGGPHPLDLDKGYGGKTKKPESEGG